MCMHISTRERERERESAREKSRHSIYTYCEREHRLSSAAFSRLSRCFFLLPIGAAPHDRSARSSVRCSFHVVADVPRWGVGAEGDEGAQEEGLQAEDGAEAIWFCWEEEEGKEGGKKGEMGIIRNQGI